jgi:gamma-glutamyltranspeptidase / glutathione hydrolase
MPLQPAIAGRRHMVAAGHHLAALAGYEVLEAGGNAIDAGVAGGIALGVLHSDQVQFSGVAPILIHLAESGEDVVVAGLGHWPQATRPEYFFDDCRGSIPLGVRRTVVPAAPDAWITALRRWGTMSFGEVAGAAVKYAREGFAMHWYMALFLERYAANYAKWPSNAAIYLKGGRPYREGELFVQADLAASLQFMADEERAAAGRGREAGLKAARDAFYKGDLARAIVRHQAEHDGWLSGEDLAGYSSPIEAPVKVRFGELEVLSCGAWCQGPTLLQMLKLLEGVDLKAMEHNSTAYIHTVTEAMKLAFADRERYFGDPGFVEVPLEGLLSDAYAARRRAEIDPAKAFPGMPPAGLPEGAAWRAEPMYAESAVPPALSADTSYVCAVDAHGNVFSATPSDVSFEAPIVSGLGFCPSTRGSQSFAIPGHPSAPAPGKRPRLTPNPSIARIPNKFVMPLGTPGGDVQTQAMAQVLLNVALWGMEAQDAVEAPRFATHSFPGTFEPHDYHPGRLEVEGRIGAAATDALAALGHKVDRLEPISYRVGGVCAIRADLESGTLWGAADPRRPARAVGR